MAWTAGTLRSAITSYLQEFETTFVATYVDQAIIQCEDRISKAVILPMNRYNATLTFTALDDTVDLPEGFLAPFELRAVNVGQYSPVDYVDVSFMRSAYPDPTVTGTPRYYSIYDATQIILAPAPTGGITGWFNYFKKPASITSGDDNTVTWLGTNAPNCLLYGSLSEAYSYLKGAPELQVRYESEFKDALAALAKLGEGMDMGDAYRMGERRQPR